MSAHYREAVIALLGDGPMSSVDLHRRLGVDPQHGTGGLRKVLRVLIEAGDITLSGKGTEYDPRIFSLAEGRDFTSQATRLQRYCKIRSQRAADVAASAMRLTAGEQASFEAAYREAMSRPDQPYHERPAQPPKTEQHIAAVLAAKVIGFSICRDDLRRLPSQARAA